MLKYSKRCIFFRLHQLKIVLALLVKVIILCILLSSFAFDYLHLALFSLLFTSEQTHDDTGREFYLLKSFELEICDPRAQKQVTAIL